GPRRPCRPRPRRSGPRAPRRRARARASSRGARARPRACRARRNRAAGDRALRPASASAHAPSGARPAGLVGENRGGPVEALDALADPVGPLLRRPVAERVRLPRRVAVEAEEDHGVARLAGAPELDEVARPRVLELDRAPELVVDERALARLP